MRTIKYMRWEYHEEEPEARSAPLWAFLYDIPYLAACDIFPPRHVLNYVLSKGGSDGGMGPGTTWEPFQVSESEYAEIVLHVINPDRTELERYARFIYEQWQLDHELDYIEDFEEWAEASCKKHQAEFQKRIGGSQEAPLK